MSYQSFGLRREWAAVLARRNLASPVTLISVGLLDTTAPVYPTLAADQPRGSQGYDADMAKTADDLRAEVLALPAQERARIASDLLASLDSEAVDEDEIDRLWSAETQRRAAMLESGDAGTLTWGDIEQRFAERRAQRGA